MTEIYRLDSWQIMTKIDIQGLLQALASPDANIRNRAAAALLIVGNPDAVPTLKATLAKEGEVTVKSTIVKAIRALGEPTFSAEPIAEAASNGKDTSGAEQKPFAELSPYEKLIRKLQSNNNDVVINAAQELGDLGNKLAVEPLILLFNNPKKSIQVRHAVAEALLKLESAPVEVALLANLRHADWHIRRNGAAILGQLKAEWAIQPLSQALRDVHPTVRRTARAALRNISTPESRKALAQAEQSAARSPMESTTPGGLAVKRVGQESKPRSKMLQRLDGEDESPQTIAQRPPVKGGTRPLDADDVPDNLPDATTRHHMTTQPLDPDVVDKYTNNQQSSE